MAAIDGVEFPDLSGWLPSVDRLNFVGETLLRLAGAALEAVDHDGFYTRQVVSHGQQIPVEPSVGGPSGQLTVACSRVFLGRPGEQLYQFDHGSPGRSGFRTAVFSMQLTRPWPIRQGQQPIPTPALVDARTVLWTDGIVVWSALVAFSLGGVRVEFWNPRADEIQIGPLQAPNPEGGMASWVIEISVQI